MPAEVASPSRGLGEPPAVRETEIAVPVGEGVDLLFAAASVPVPDGNWSIVSAAAMATAIAVRESP